MNQLTGYYYWLFLVDKAGITTDQFNKIAVEWNRDAFDQAVIERYKDAPGLGKNTFPAFTRMP